MLAWLHYSITHGRNWKWSEDLKTLTQSPGSCPAATAKTLVTPTTVMRKALSFRTVGVAIAPVFFTPTFFNSPWNTFTRCGGLIIPHFFSLPSCFNSLSTLRMSPEYSCFCTAVGISLHCMKIFMRWSFIFLGIAHSILMAIVWRHLVKNQIRPDVMAILWRHPVKDQIQHAERITNMSLWMTIQNQSPAWKRFWAAGKLL